MGAVVATTEVEEDVNGGPLGGMLPVGLAVATIKVEEDVDGGPPGGAVGGSGSSHHRCCRRHRWRVPLWGAAGGSGSSHH
jgi:hypothetical protein